MNDNNIEMEKTGKNRAFSPSRTVWRTQMAKGIYTPHRVSLITCMINNNLSALLQDFLTQLEVDAYIEQARNVRELVKPLPFGIPGDTVKLRSTPSTIFRFTVPRENAKDTISAIIALAGLNVPGRGTIFSQDLMEFSNQPPVINLAFLESKKVENDDVTLLNHLSYMICVLSENGEGDNLAKNALDLGICVPQLTNATGNDIRDQLGLIRVTIPAEKEIVHLIMPEQDSSSIAQLLAEQAKLDRPGRGFIYQTPITVGLIDTYMKIGGQKFAASMEQVIAAIDSLKGNTNWRRRLDAADAADSRNAYVHPDNCEVTIISDEDRIDDLRATCLSVGATGATTTRITRISGQGELGKQSLVRSAVSIPATMADTVVDSLLQISTIDKENVDKIKVLDSPSTYVRAL